MRNTVIAATAMLVLAHATTAAAQDVSPAGVWTFDQDVMYEDPPGSGAVKNATVRALLVIEQLGDSLTAVWTVTIPGRPEVRTRLRGSVSGRTVRLIEESPSQARLSGPDGDRHISTYQEYVLSVDGDAISGTIHVHADDENVEIPSRTIRGRRAG